MQNQTEEERGKVCKKRVVIHSLFTYVRIELNG